MLITKIYPGLTHFQVLIKSLLIYFLFFTFTLVTADTFAQFTYILDKTSRFDKMGAEEGLSTGYTSCIHQDKYGFIWIGSQYGLNLYDGYEVKVFNANPKNDQSIFNNYIFNIFEEPDGTMWFGSSTGISKYDRSNKTFINYIPDTIDISNPRNSTQKILKDGNYFWVDVDLDLFLFNKETGHFKSFAKDSTNPSKGIYGEWSRHIFFDNDGILWVVSYEPGKAYALSRFNNQSQTFTHFVSDPNDPESFANRDVRSMIEDKDRSIWIASQGSGLLELIDKENGKFKQYAHAEDDPYSILNDELLVVYEDSKGNIWTGGKDGFSRLNKNTGQFINYKIPHLSFDHSKSNYIHGISEDDKGELWFTTNDGFFRFNPSTKILRHYLHDPENKSGLSNNRVLQIMHDRSGQDWILTWSSGINKLNHFSNAFQKVEMNSFDKSSLSGNYISRILGDSKGNLWIGTYGEGLNKTSLNKTREFTDFEHHIVDAENSKSINGNRIFSIGEDKEQIIWVGTSQGLNRFNIQNNDFTRFEHNPNDSSTISNGNVEVIFEDSHGILWVGTRNGLNIMDRETGKFMRFAPDKNKQGAIASIEVREIFEDSYGELWFGGTYLDKLNRKDTSFTHYFSDSIIFRDFNKTDIWNIIEDDSANLWMTTFRDGLIKLQRNDMKVITIKTDQGLPSNSITDIEIGDKGFIWATTNQGLSRIDPHDYSIRNYDDADGLASLEFIENCSFKDEDGWLYFGTRKGFSVFHPDSIKENTHIPPVYITAFNIAGQQKYFDQPLYELENIELNYNENDFSFDFVALDYINPQKNQFAYMLEGYDEDWIYVGNKRTANYTNMTPGEYTFRVTGSNNDGYWNEEGASLAVLIYPPFWKTWWAYGAYAFIFFGLLYLFRRYELNRLHLKQNLEINQVETEKLAELDVEKNKFFSNISHEFRTPLTLILGPLEKLIVGNKNEKERDQLNLVRRNARRLQTLISQLLSLSKLESGKMKLKARPENIVKLTRLFLQSFDSMAEDRGIQLVFESDAEEHIIYIDTLKFEKVTNNLLSNGFKFTERGGKIKVTITRLDPPLSIGENEPGGINIKFSDTGIGIHKEKLPHVFDRFYQVDEEQMKTNLGTGIGLSLTKDLIELHHGTITVDSEAKIGTTFTVVLPIGKEHLSEDEIFESAKNGSEMEDDLLNDDYLFVQDAVSKTELITEMPEDSSLPLFLIVEDNEDMRAYIKSYLIDSYNILEASNGRDGAEIAIEHLPDLIVSDLMMPIMDGNEMTNQLKNDERTSHIPIILLTAKSSTASKLEGLETGADDFLTKPFDADELLVRIKNLIEQRRKLRVLLSRHIGDIPQTRIIKESAGKVMSKIDEQFLEKAKDVVDEQMADPDFSVELFAEKMAMSRIQLHRKLTSLTDNSAGDLIREIRLVKAAELLKQGELNVTQVSYEIGISSLSYFAKAFKEKHGVPPSEFS